MFQLRKIHKYLSCQASTCLEIEELYLKTMNLHVYIALIASVIVLKNQLNLLGIRKRKGIHTKNNCQKREFCKSIRIFDFIY